MMRGWIMWAICIAVSTAGWAQTNNVPAVAEDTMSTEASRAGATRDMPENTAPIEPNPEDAAEEEEADVPTPAVTYDPETVERAKTAEPAPLETEPTAPAPEPPKTPEPDLAPTEPLTAWDRWMIHTRYFFAFTLPQYFENFDWSLPSFSSAAGAENPHWDIGWRFRQYSFFEDQKGEPGGNNTYFGSIYKIEDDHSFFPGMPYVQYRFNPYVGAGLTYDTIVARTVDVGDRGKPTEHKSSDGDIEMKGPALYVLGRYANDSKFTPFAELGMIFYGTSFNAEGDWGRRNRLELEDDNGIFVAGGCDYRINNNFSVEVFLRRTSVKTRGTWYLNNRTMDDDVNFDLGNLAYGIGAKYSF